MPDAEHLKLGAKLFVFRVGDDEAAGRRLRDRPSHRPARQAAAPGSGGTPGRASPAPRGSRPGRDPSAARPVVGNRGVRRLAGRLIEVAAEAQSDRRRPAQASAPARRHSAPSSGGAAAVVVQARHWGRRRGGIRIGAAVAPEQRFGSAGAATALGSAGLPRRSDRQAWAGGQRHSDRRGPRLRSDQRPRSLCLERIRIGRSAAAFGSACGLTAIRGSIGCRCAGGTAFGSTGAIAARIDRGHGIRIGGGAGYGAFGSAERLRPFAATVSFCCASVCGVLLGDGRFAGFFGFGGGAAVASPPHAWHRRARFAATARWRASGRRWHRHSASLA